MILIGDCCCGGCPVAERRSEMDGSVEGEEWRKRTQG
jgi:hypothetical protein